MPLLDHFHDTVRSPVQWSSVHSQWAAEIVRRLNSHWLGRRFVAATRATVAEHSEIDIAEYDTGLGASGGGNGQSAGVPDAALLPWSAGEPVATAVADIPALNEVRIHSQEYGELVAAIEIVSPSNKDRPNTRDAFVGKCLDYIGQGVCVVIIDVVTTRRANLHNAITTLMDAPAARLPESTELYAATYRPVTRKERVEMDVWTAPCAVGQSLPTMPMRLTGDTFVPVEFELTYVETCGLLRLSR
jgi:hypothetical protein